MAKISGSDAYVIFGSAVSVFDASYASGVVTVTTTAPHGKSVKDRVRIRGVVGMTDLNNSFTIETVPTSTTFTVSLTTAQSYTSGGSIYDTIDVTNWTLDLAADVIDVTDSSSVSNFREFIDNEFSSGTGTLDGFVYSGTNHLVEGTSLAAQFRMSDTEYYSGTGYITGDTTTTDVSGAEAVKITYNFTFSGAISQT